MNHSKIVIKTRLAASELRGLTDSEIRLKSLALKHCATIGKPVQRLILEAFPLVMEATRRCLGLVYHDVQLICGIEMMRGRIAEMKTGEGKTLTATLAGYIFALYGQGVHIVTFNDYLAQRDCETLRPIYELLGLTVAVVYEGLDRAERSRAYRCDITYGAAKEFGFDFLRDRLQRVSSGNANAGVMRGTNYALIDEADSILIDEARTPLIIGMRDQTETMLTQSCYLWAAEHAELFEESIHYNYDVAKQKVTLNSTGMLLARSLPQDANRQRVSVRQLYDYLQNAIKVRREFHRDKHYAIREGEIVIIDEFTGRPAEGRQWQHGIHQSVQAKEGLSISPATRPAASITIQSFFKRYSLFCGMTGTAWTSRRELLSVYKKRVARIPTHRPINRLQHPTCVFASVEQKFEAVVQSAQHHVALGRSVLIGTRSVGSSEAIAACFRKLGVTFDILNANHQEREAEVIEQAGQSAKITIATNMAGRGTDIKLCNAVRDAGGLHVILTEIHESQRIDWQLIGRGSRQGDPGSYQIFVALDDEILRVGFGPQKARRLMSKFAGVPAHRLNQLFPLFRKAQRKIERRYLIDRLILLRQDLEQQQTHFELGKDPYLSVVGG